MNALCSSISPSLSVRFVIKKKRIVPEIVEIVLGRSSSSSYKVKKIEF